MDVRPDSKIAGLINSIEEEKTEQTESDRETAMQFPESAEDYLALPVEDRMMLAGGMLATYYPFLSYDRFDEKNPTENKYVKARVATDQPGFVINGRISYYRGDAMPPTQFYKPRALYVWAQAENTLDSSRSSFKPIGRIEVGQIIRASEANEYPSGFDLDDARAIEMIELIDDGIGNLIEGIIATHRNASLGRRALQDSAS